MDLSVKLVLRAQSEGVSAIKEMREETAELAAAMKEVREAARSGGNVSASTIKQLGGFNEFQKAFEEAQKELAGGVKEAAPFDEEKAFRGRLRMLNAQSKVRLSESERTDREEAAAFAKAEQAKRREAIKTGDLQRKLFLDEVRATKATQAEMAAAVARGQADMRRSMEETLAYNMRYWAARGRAAEREAAEEARLDRQRRDALRSMGLGLFAGREEGGAHGRGGVAGGGGHRGRGLMAELGTAAEYTLTYGAINKVLEGIGAVAHSPIDIGKMTLGVAEQARQVKDLGKATGLTTNQVQELQYAFQAKGLDADKLPQTLLFLARSEVGAARGIKNNAVAFKALGVSIFDAHHRLKPLQQLLYETTDALHHQSSAAKEDAISQMIFGRGIKDILPVIQGGSAALRQMASEADKSGFVITPEDLERGELLAAQWSKLKLQLMGVRNTAAVAAMPIVSDLVGEASSYLTAHRDEVTKAIRDNFIEIKADIPIIVSGMKTLAGDTLAMSRNIGPFFDDIVKLSQNPFVQYMLSGQIIPGYDLGRAPPSHAGGGPVPFDSGPPMPYDAETHRPAEVHVHVHAAPGVAVGATRSRGATVQVHRGQLGAGS